MKWHSIDIRVAAFLSALMLIGCTNDETASSSRLSEADSIRLPDTEAFGARIQLYDGSRVTTAVEAERVVKYTAVDSTMAYGLDIDVFDTTGKHTADIVGDSGIIREKTGDMSLYGNVVVNTSDGIKLMTEFLYWDAQVDSVKTHAYVRLTRGEDVISGYGLQADQRLHSTKILRQVSGTITDPQKLEGKP